MGHSGLRTRIPLAAKMSSISAASMLGVVIVICAPLPATAEPRSIAATVAARQAAPATSASFPVFSAAAGAPIASPEILWQHLKAASLCTRQPGGALSSARLVPGLTKSLLLHREGARAVGRLSVLTKGKSALFDRRVAGQAVVANRPGAALQALMAALAKAPRDVGTLLDASAVLESLGRPQLALSLLGSLPRGTRFSPLLQANRARIALIRGFADLHTGEVATAVSDFVEALRFSPHSIEAATGATAAASCLGSESRALAYYMKTRLLSDGAPGFIVDPFDGSRSADFALTNGTDMTDPWQVNLPQGVPALGSSYDYFAAKDDAVTTQSVDDGRAYGAALAALDGPLSNDPHTPDAVLTFDQSVERALAEASHTASTLPMEQAAAVAKTAWQTYRLDHIICGTGCPDVPTQVGSIYESCRAEFPDDETAFNNCYQPQCQAVVTPAIGHETDLAQQAINEEAAAAKAVHRVETGLATLTASVVREKAYLRGVKSDDENSLSEALDIAHLLTLDARGFASCFEDPPPPLPPEQTSVDDPTAAGPCSVKGYSYSVSVDVIELSVSCDSFKVKLSTPGPVGFFVQGGYAFGSGAVTIFTGGKLGVTLGVGSGGVTGQVNEGFYVTIGSHSIEDFGVRGELTGKVSGGPEAGQLKATLAGQYSLVPAFGLPK